MNMKSKECNNETIFEGDAWEPAFNERDVVPPCDACGQAREDVMGGPANFGPNDCPDCGQPIKEKS